MSESNRRGLSEEQTTHTDTHGSSEGEPPPNPTSLRGLEAKKGKLNVKISLAEFYVGQMVGGGYDLTDLCLCQDHHTLKKQ